MRWRASNMGRILTMATEPPAPCILVVDDEPQIRSLLADILTDQGYRVDTAEDGVAALQSVVATPPDLVLLDVDLPRLRGVDTLVAIQGLAPDTKVIMISGRATEAEAQQALDAGAFDYIAKPFDLAYLDQAVRTAVLL
jgi:DNA-binding response OmpR family regulator